MLNPMQPKTALPRLDDLALLHVVEHSQAMIATLDMPLGTLSQLTLNLVHELALRAADS